MIRVTRKRDKKEAVDDDNDDDMTPVAVPVSSPTEHKSDGKKGKTNRRLAQR
jgi:hypothetical protein